MTVAGILIGIENNAPIKYGQDAFHAACHRGVPKLQMPSVFFFPIFIQEDQGIDSPIEL
jgi:hypothetical protein